MLLEDWMADDLPKYPALKVAAPFKWQHHSTSILIDRLKANQSVLKMPMFLLMFPTILSVAGSHAKLWTMDTLGKRECLIKWLSEAIEDRRLIGTR
jgi:hypothetical protein